MWIRKSSEELEEQKIKTRRDPIPPLVVGVLGALLSLIYERSISVFILGFILFFVLSYLGQILTGNLLIFALDFYGAPVSTVICNTCHRTKTMDKALLCDCGGTFEPFENWKWVEDEKG